ncbi:FMN-binding protein [Clostridium sp. BJN0013]
MEDLFQKVIELQSLQVDIISGATLTSKAHLKALENALKQELKE